MFTITAVLFGIGILALILQIAMTTKKEWFAFVFYAAVAAIFWQLYANIPWFRDIVIALLKLIPWLIGRIPNLSVSDDLAYLKLLLGT